MTIEAADQLSNNQKLILQYEHTNEGIDYFRFYNILSKLKA